MTNKALITSQETFRNGYILFILLLLGLRTSNAQISNAPSRLDYSAFRIITDRNIFNPRRSARYVPTERTRRVAAPRTDSFVLVGTMSYEKGLFAFFDGSSAEYRKVLKQDDTIAGFKVAEIEASHVKLSSPTNQVELHVGMQLRHDEDGTWHVTDRPESVAPSSVSASGSRVPPPSSINRPSVGLVRAGDASLTNALLGGAQPFIDGGLLPGSGEAQEPAFAPDAATAPASPAGGENDILERLRRRAAAERGENPQ